MSRGVTLHMRSRCESATMMISRPTLSVGNYIELKVEFDLSNSFSISFFMKLIFSAFTLNSGIKFL